MYSKRKLHCNFGLVASASITNLTDSPFDHFDRFDREKSFFAVLRLIDMLKRGMNEGEPCVSNASGSSNGLNG